MKLTKEEKAYLFSKLEYTKKKKAIESENDVYTLLNTDVDVNEDDFKKILNSLEYTFRQRLLGSKPDLNSDIFKAIKDKLPEGWIPVKFSNLENRKKKLEKKPTDKSTKEEIMDYLKRNKIEFDESKSKKDLLGMFENNHVKTFEGFKNN